MRKQKASADSCSVFEYLYRDTGNWKVWGGLNLAGIPSKADCDAIRQAFESEQFFNAEQLGIPTLRAPLFAHTNGPTEDDHIWHEFVDMRVATEDDLKNNKVWGSLEDFIQTITAIKRWNVTPDWLQQS